MNEFFERLRREQCLLLDGGLGSELINRGLPPGTPPERWTLERPEDVVAVHRAYVRAGSDAIHANTFGANATRLGRHGLSDRIVAVNRTAARLAREAGARFVIADIGPTGEYLAPLGRGDPQEWRRQFEEQGRILAEAAVDGFHVETMVDVREARVALEALREAAPALPILVSLAFERKKRGFFTIMGDPLVPSLIQLWEAGAAAVGANCSIMSRDMLDLAGEALARTSASIVLQPNAGSPERTADGIRYGQAPEEFAKDLSSLLPEPRIMALGGCCGTDPRFIAALRAHMKE
jgi:5-methyltetrahydrofolate--homocysteine methyltransferase